MSWAFENGEGHRIDEPSAQEMKEYSREGKMRAQIEEVKSLIHVLRASVQPLPEHTDPQSVDDCWNELLDDVERFSKI